MQNKRFKPKYDKSFVLIWIPTVALLFVTTIIGMATLVSALIMIFTDAFTLYFLFTSIVGYVELREESVFVKFGFFMKRDIPYNKIRAIDTAHKFYADSMLSLKNSLDHVNIRYNRFDIVSVSVKENDELIAELNARRERATAHKDL